MAVELTAADAGIIATLILLEAALSFDNAAILAAITRRLPKEQRKRALNLGLMLAYILRLGAIALVFVLIKFPVLAAIGGAYLIFLFVKHFWHVWRHHELGHAPKGNIFQALGLSAFAATIVQIGFIDLAFAVDQVVAAVGFTKEIWLIVIAASIGLLSLRILAPHLSRLMDWAPLLEHVAYVAVGFVGAILLLDYANLEGWTHAHLSTAVKVSVTLGLFGLPVVLRLFGLPRRKPVPANAE